MDGLTEGRIVHFVMENGKHRPAVVVETWQHVPSYQEEGVVNLQVFTDGTNDGYDDHRNAAGIRWETSVHYSEGKEARTWHWIEKA